MRRTYKTEGIILKRVSIGEADRIVTIFSKNHGKLTLIAKGVRRITSRRAPNLELFNYTKFVLHKGKKLDVISDAQTVISFAHCKKNLTRIAHAYLITELIDRLLADGQKQRKIFNVALLVFQKLDDKNSSDQIVHAYMHRFKYFLLENLGFIPSDGSFANTAIDTVIEDIIERKLKSTTVFQ